MSLEMEKLRYYLEEVDPQKMKSYKKYKIADKNMKESLRFKGFSCDSSQFNFQIGRDSDQDSLRNHE